MPKTIPLGTYLFIHKCRCIMLNYLSVEVDRSLPLTNV